MVSSANRLEFGLAHARLAARGDAGKDLVLVDALVATHSQRRGIHKGNAAAGAKAGLEIAINGTGVCGISSTKRVWLTRAGNSARKWSQIY
jgi:hypothetical protein